MRHARRLIPYTVLVLLLTSTLAATASAEEPKVAFQEFDDLLFTNLDYAYETAVDPVSGDLWTATSGGLVRVTAASNFTERHVLGEAEGLPTPLVFRITFDADGTLWVGTDRGLARVEPGAGPGDERVTYWNPDNSDAPAFVLTAVAPDTDGTVWVGTHSKGLTRFDPASETWDGPWVTDAEEDDSDTITALVLTPERVYVAAANHGFLTYDRATGDLAPVDGDVTGRARTVLVEEGGVVWYGTERGLWRHAGDAWHSVNGTKLVDRRVTDLSLVGDTLHIGTFTGVTLLDVTNLTAETARLGRASALLPGMVNGVTTPSPDTAFYATERGVTRMTFNGSFPDVGIRQVRNFVTGPDQGPNANSLFKGTVHDGIVWFGTSEGVTGYDPAQAEWTSLGVTDGLLPESRPVFAVEGDEDRLLLATKEYVWVLNATAGEWILVGDEQGTNHFMNLDVEGDVLWLPQYGTGLYKYNWRENETQRYDISRGLWEPRVTDVHAGEDAVWVTTHSGLYALDRVTDRFEPRGNFPTHELTGLWPDGGYLWVAMRDDGIATYNTATGNVEDTFNTTNGGLPGDDVRDVVRDGRYAWLALGPDGLARLDTRTGEVVDHFTAENGLAAGWANGLVLHDDVLYVGSHVGLSRLDTSGDAFQFLPRYVPDPDAIRVTDGNNPSQDRVLQYPPRVSFTSHASGDVVADRVLLHGDASKPGGSVDRVEVSVNGGPWRIADGVSPWTFEWETAELEPGRHIVTARAIAGDEVSEEVDLRVRVVPPPETPLTLDHVPPESAAYAERPVTVTARATGDDPLSVTLNYKAEGAGAYRTVSLREEGGAWRATIPAEDVTAGNLTYYLEARSGHLTTTLPEDTDAPFTLHLEEPPAASVTVNAPPSVDVAPGESASFDLLVRNTGTQDDTYALATTGLRASWVTVDEAPFALAAGDEVTRTVTVDAPEAAFADDTVLTFAVNSVGRGADPATVTVPLTVLPAEDAEGETQKVDGETDADGGFFLPAPGLVVGILAALGAALMTRSRNGGDA